MDNLQDNFVQDDSQVAQQPISTLGAMAGGGTAPTQTVQSQPTTPSQPAPQPKSRLQAIISAVANVAATGLQGIPDTGRPGFVQGLGEGARAQQAVKFKN